MGMSVDRKRALAEAFLAGAFDASIEVSPDGTPEITMTPEEFARCAELWSDIRTHVWKRLYYSIDGAEAAALAKALEVADVLERFWSSNSMWRYVDQWNGFDKPRGRPRTH